MEDGIDLYTMDGVESNEWCVMVVFVLNEEIGQASFLALGDDILTNNIKKAEIYQSDMEAKQVLDSYLDALKFMGKRWPNKAYVATKSYFVNLRESSTTN